MPALAPVLNPPDGAGCGEPVDDSVEDDCVAEFEAGVLDVVVEASEDEDEDEVLVVLEDEDV